MALISAQATNQVVTVYYCMLKFVRMNLCSDGGTSYQIWLKKMKRNS